MVTIKIYCNTCHNSWNVYKRGINDPDANVCPHCGAYIERQTWENQVVAAWAMADDANREILRDATGYHRPLFSVSFLKGKDSAKMAQMDMLEMETESEDVENVEI